MKMIQFVVALLLTGLGNDAAASVRPDTASQKKAAKINAYLDAIGINNPKIKQFANTIGTRMEKGRLRLAEQRFDHGRLVLTFQMQPRIHSEKLELKYQPDNSRFEYTATPKGAMVRFRWEFN